MLYTSHVARACPCSWGCPEMQCSHVWPVGGQAGTLSHGGSLLWVCTRGEGGTRTCSGHCFWIMGLWATVPVFPLPAGAL